MKGIEALFDKGPVVLFKWRNAPGWPVEDVSNNVHNLLGYTSKETTASQFEYGKLIHSEDIVRVTEEVTQYSQAGALDFSHQPYRLITKDGSLIWVKDQTHIIRNDEGLITHYTGYIYDITEQVSSENELRAAKEKLQATIDSIGNLIFVLDESGNYLEFYVSDDTESLFDGPEFLLGKHYSEVMPSEIAVLIEEYLSLTAESGTPQSFEYQLTVRGKVRSFSCKITASTNHRNGTNKYTFVTSDITETKASEKKIKEFYELFSKSNDLLVISDFEGQVEAVNPRWNEIFGYTLSDINEKGLLHFVHPSDKRQVYVALKRIRTDHSDLFKIDCRVIAKNGTFVWLEWVSTLDYDNKKVYSVARDITEIKSDQEKTDALSNGMFHLTQKSQLLNSTLDEFLAEVAKASCDLLEIDRFTYWKIQGDNMSCICCYDRVQNGYITLPQISMVDCPKYFRALKNQRIVSSPDPPSDPRFAELTDSYFNPHEIKSTMDTSIIGDKGPVGVLCAETISHRRYWNSSDEKDLSSISEIIRNAINIDEKNATYAALRRSEQLMSALTDRMPGLVYIKEPDGKHLFANSTTLDFFDMDLKTYQNMTHHDLFDKEFADKLSSDDIYCVNTGETIYNEVKDPQGADEYYEEYKFPIELKGSPPLVGGIVLNTTERIRARQELEASESKYKMLVEFTNAVHWKMDLKSGVFTYMDEKMLELSGYPASEFKTMEDWASKIHPDERESTASTCSLLSSQGKNHELVYRNIKPDGSIIWIRDSISVLNENGKPSHLVGYMIDITEEIKSELRLKASESRFRALVNNIQVGILVQDHESKILLSNPRALELLGLKEEQLLGKSAYDPDWNITRPNGTDFPNEELPVPVAIREKRPVNSVIMGVFRANLDDRVWLQVDANPQISDNGTVGEVICTFVDITKRIAAQEERNESLLNLQLAEQIAEIGYWSYDPVEDLQVWSDQVYRIFEVSKEDYDPKYGGQSYRMSPEDFERLTEAREKAIKDGTSYSLELKFKFNADRYKWVQIICETSNIEGHDQYFSRGTIQDITSKKLVQEKLVEFTKLQSLLMDLSSNYINMPSEKVDQSVNDTLHRLGEFAGIDRAYVFEYSPDFNVSICINSWIRPGIRKIELNKPFTMTGLEEYVQAHLSGNFYQVPDIEQESNEKIKQNYKAYNIKSLISVPMLQDGLCIGFIGFDAVRTKRSFNPREVDLLKLFAELLVNLRQKVRYENSLKAKQLDLEAALSEKDTLFKELHHRIKNNLQLVSSLLYLKLDSVSNPQLSAFINETIARILSISKIHDQLLRIEEVHELDIKNYIEDLTRNIVNTYSKDQALYPLKIKVDHANFHIDDVLLIGLLINESVSNIIKYAYSYEVGGPIEISLTLSTDNSVELTITDFGKGLPFDSLEDATQSHGIQLIKVFAEQLKGTLSLSPIQGTSYQVRFVKRR